MSKWTIHHPAVFLLTFLSYALFHAVRKTLSNVKSTYADEWTPCTNGINKSETSRCTPVDTWDRDDIFFRDRDRAEEFLGALDAAFLFAYAAGLYVSGSIADRLDLRLVLSFGMISTAVVVFVFGPVMEWCDSKSEPVYITLMVVNGLLQSTGWPCVVAVMGNWFGKNSRGVVMGLWSACQSVGNIVGALLVAAVVEHGHEYAFMLTSCTLFAAGILVFAGLIPSPLEVGLPLADEEGETAVIHPDRMINTEVVVSDNSDDVNRGKSAVRGEINFGADLPENGITRKVKVKTAGADSPSRGAKSPLGPAESSGADKKREEGEEADNSATTGANSKTAAPGEASRPKAVGFLTALLLPGVIPYSLAYAFLKLVNYAFFFWLPFYLSEAYGWREAKADQLSTWYDVGGIIGGTAAGFISDRFEKRAVVVTPMLVLSIPMLFIYGNVSAGERMNINAVMLCCLGVLVGGVANLISAAISADLGRQDAIRGNSEALSTVTGIVDGTGSLGAAVGQVAVPYLQVGLGWKSVFYLFMAAVAVTVGCILPIFIGEVKLVVRNRRNRRRDDVD